MDEITLDDKTYVSSKRAAKITGYAKDYVGQLCREGRVEARLVGRNWYVLESSVREHRFGSGTIKNDESVHHHNENITESTWQPNSYLPEPVLTFPNIPQRSLETKQYSAIGAPIAESTVVKEMQNAWQDWFIKKNEEKAAEEPLPEAIETPEPISEGLSEPDAVHITRVPEELTEETPVETAAGSSHGVTFEEDEEVVPLHRTYMPPVTVVPPSYRQAYAPQDSLAPKIYAPEGRIIRERRVSHKKKPSLILTVLFLSIAAISIVVAGIGSGVFDEFLNTEHSTYAPIQYINGENDVINHSK
jgi:hypothetical protein